MPPKRYRDVYLREEIYKQLLQLKAILGKRSVNDVVEELLKYFTVNTVNSPVNTVKLTVSTVKPTVSTGELTVSSPVNTVNSPVSTGESPVNTVTDELDHTNEVFLKELDKRFKRLEDLINVYTGKTDSSKVFPAY